MAATQNGPELRPTTLELARGANFAAIAAVMPGGKRQNHYVWAGTDGERLFVNIEVHRQKYKNVERDPNVTLTIRDEKDPYRYAEVRGEVVEAAAGQKARDDIDALSRKYNGEAYPPDDIKTERVTLWIVPSRQTTVGSGDNEGNTTDQAARRAASRARASLCFALVSISAGQHFSLSYRVRDAASQ